MKNAKILEPWDEACGTLQKIVEEDPYIIIDFGKFRVRLGLIDAKTIRGLLSEDLIGRGISILKTDLPGKPLLMLVK